MLYIFIYIFSMYVFKALIKFCTHHQDYWIFLLRYLLFIKMHILCPDQNHPTWVFQFSITINVCRFNYISVHEFIASFWCSIMIFYLKLDVTVLLVGWLVLSRQTKQICKIVWNLFWRILKTITIKIKSWIFLCLC